MTRGLGAALQTALQQTVVRAGWLVLLENTGATVYLTSRTRNVTWDSKTWLANNWLRPGSSFNESVDVRANNATVKIAGLDETAVALTLSTFNHSKKCRIYLAAFSESGVVVVDPYLCFEGYFDKATIRDTGEDSEIVLNYETEFIRGRNAAGYRMTNQSQQALFTGDVGFEYTALVEDWSGFWGIAARPNFTKKRKTKNK